MYGEANALYWKSFERQNSTHLTLLKHQITKTAQYKLPKNHWVMALFGPSEKKLLVTVLLNHPVFQNLSQSGLLLLPDLVNTLVSYYAGLDGGDRD